MDRARTDRGRVSRLVTRTLFVLGGTVAATAVGWAISSASAAADTLPTIAVPGTHADPAPVSGTVTGVLGAVDVPTLPQPPAATGALSSAVTRLGSHVGGDLPVSPLAAARPLLPLLPQPKAPYQAPIAAGQSGPAIGPAAARPIPAVTTVAPTTSGPATVVRWAHRQAVVPPVAPLSTPTVPGPAAPWSPVTVPSAPGGSVGGAPGGTGLGLADASGVLPVPGLDVVRVVPVTVPPGRVTAGRQPGSTPD
ncbi:MAG TPA: hypothetical protein VF892_05965 [Pseudonocardiaceae bacterium]